MVRVTLKISITFLLLLQNIIGLSQKVELAGNTQREEIHRYFGYEVLPYRYLSLPYDACINNNEKAIFVEIGFHYLAFLPLLILLFLYRKLWARLLIIPYLIFTWIISTSNSFVFSYKYAILRDKDISKVDYLLDDAVSFFQEPSAHIAAYMYHVSSILYQPFEAIANGVSGDRDFITYPLLIGLFIISAFFLAKVVKEIKTSSKIIVLTFWFFLFFWIKYSAGIIWYGFPVMVMALLLSFKLLEKGNPSYPVASRFFTISMLTTSVIWVVSAMLLRIGEVQNNNPAADLGKDMYSSVFYKYQIGQSNVNDVITTIYPGNFDKALAKINSESESLIYRVGTSFSYFIKNNSQRIILDNQLGLFNSIQSKYEDVNVIKDVLKASGIKYFIVDLNTPYIDSTPEKTLEKKYHRLMYFFRNTKGVKLLSTNRVIRSIDNSGNESFTYKVFGNKALKGKDIVQGGQYAIFEIL